MFNRLDKIKFTLYLDPQGNKADLYTRKILKKWASDLDALGSSSENAMDRLHAVNIHKQIYMSGLYLHLLSPTASRQLSNLVIDGEVNTTNLLKSLVIGDIHEAAELDESAILNSGNTSMELSESNSAELNQIVDAINALRDGISSNPDADTKSVDVEVKSDIKEILDLVKGYSPAQADSSKTDLMIAGLSEQLKRQNQLLEQISRNGIQAGGAKLSQDSNPETGRAVVTGDMEPELASRAEKVRRAKKKAVF